MLTASEKLKNQIDSLRVWRETYQSKLDDLAYRALGITINLMTSIQSEVSDLEEEIASLKRNIERLK